MTTISTRATLERLLRERILFLDGATGTSLQKAELVEADYRGDRFAEHRHDLLGNHDVLVLTRPDVVREIHDSFLAVGADLLVALQLDLPEEVQGDLEVELALVDVLERLAEYGRKPQ